MKKKVVLWIPQGRLGNLLFQYQAAKALFPSERSRVISFENELPQFFDIDISGINFIKLPNFYKSTVQRLLTATARWCAKQGVLGLVTPKLARVHDETYSEQNTLLIREGFFSGWYLLDGFFQHDLYVSPLPQIKQTLVINAEKKLLHIPIEKRVALHLRFGDYEKWTVLGKQGVCLPASYYREAISRVRNYVEDPVFVLFSDDRKKAEQLIGTSCRSYIFNGVSEGEDLAGIACCSHAIISASSFSWWGAYLIRNPNKLIIAPKYWAGYKSHVWFPLGIETKSFSYIEVQQTEAN